MFKKRSIPDNVRQSTRSIAHRPANVFSYHAARDQRENGDNRQPELLVQRERSMHNYGRRALTVLALVAAALLLGSATTLQAKPRVVVLGSLTDQTLLQDTGVYEETAKQLLSASAANRNKFTIDTNTIAKTLQEKYPELASVSVVLPLLSHTPRVEIQPAVPSLMLKTNSGGVFVIANSGRVLALASTVRQLSSLQLPVVDDQSGLQAAVGSTVLPSTNVSFIQLVLQQFQAKHTAVTGMILPRGQSELDVKIASKPFIIKLNFEADAKQQIGTYFATSRYLEEKKITPGQYIDARTLGRVYYK